MTTMQDIERKLRTWAKRLGIPARLAPAAIVDELGRRAERAVAGKLADDAPALCPHAEPMPVYGRRRVPGEYGKWERCSAADCEHAEVVVRAEGHWQCLDCRKRLTLDEAVRAGSIR